MPSKFWRGYHSISCLSKSVKIYHSGNASEPNLKQPAEQPFLRARRNGCFCKLTLKGLCIEWCAAGANPLKSKTKERKKRLVIFGEVMVRFCLRLLAVGALCFSSQSATHRFLD